MPQIIIKAARHRDLYLVWSTVVDNAIVVGTRAEVHDWLLAEHGRSSRPEEALARADINGSSDRAAKFGWWDDGTLPVGEGSPDDGWYHIRRERLLDYAEALLRDDDAAAVALLECWSRHDEADDD